MKKVTLIFVKLVYSHTTMSFQITELNILISSFLPRYDTVSFLKSSRDLRNDLHNIPFKSFILEKEAGMTEMKAMLSHMDVIETLEIRGCTFVEYLLLPMKRLRELKLVDCNSISHTELYNKFKTLKRLST